MGETIPTRPTRPLSAASSGNLSCSDSPPHCSLGGAGTWEVVPDLAVVVTTNQPDQAPDWEIDAHDDGSFDVWLRGSGDETSGRVYAISATASDCSGNTATRVESVDVKP